MCERMDQDEGEGQQGLFFFTKNVKLTARIVTNTEQIVCMCSDKKHYYCASSRHIVAL